MPIYKAFFHFLNEAARTKNYSGAELEGVVKSAVSFALNRQISMDDLTKPLDEESIKVTMDDFLHALHEIVPAFGASTDDLERCRYFFFSSFIMTFKLGILYHSFKLESFLSLSSKNSKTMPNS